MNKQFKVTRKIFNKFCCIYFAPAPCRESLHDIIALLRNSSKPNAEKILGVIKKWAKENRINL